jgi:hypothetical protein
MQSSAPPVILTTKGDRHEETSNDYIGTYAKHPEASFFKERQGANLRLVRT